LPGHLLVAESDSVRIERYWEPRPSGEQLSEDEWLERVRETVREAVAMRLRADVPLGALLSGGIDSTLVVALMAEASSQAVRTFTVGFEDERYDERPYARAVAERYGTVHEELAPEEDVVDTVHRLARAFDEPLGDEAALPTFLICEEAQRHVTVALTGDGGDESFAGYERYAAFELAERVPGSIARAARPALRLLPSARRVPRSPLFRAARMQDVAATPRDRRYTRLMDVLSLDRRRRLWAGEVAGDVQLRPHAPGTAGLQLLDIGTYLAGDLLPKADIASMAHSLELRSPLLDHRVVELGLSLPDSLRMRGRTGKIALRRAFAELLPPEVAGRGKSGFGVPLGRWFRNDLRELTRDTLRNERGWFRNEEMARLVSEHESGHADHGHRLWCLLMLELWLAEHVDAPVLVAA
jgi:asparagine synthase (glutamine-hydrolysing)